MVTKQIPNRCIWCRGEPPSATFKSESHVLPECVGNERQQVLPQGIVCDDCNNHFGTKVEVALIDDPIFSTLVGILQLRDKKCEFAYESSLSGVHRIAHMEAKVSANKIAINTQYEITGQPSKPNETRTINKSKIYKGRDLALLSRAVHKIAFEAMAHSLFIGKGLEFEKTGFKDIDIFGSSFDVIRSWARYGEPQSSVRPVLRLQKLEEAKFQWECFLWGFDNWLRSELDLFGDWYIVSLTSLPDEVDKDLRIWVQRSKFDHPVWYVGQKLMPMT